MHNQALNNIIHGVAVTVYNKGVVIIGDSGIGKSECALELFSRGHSLVADDVIRVESVDGHVFASAPERFAALIEIRGLGIFDVRQIFGPNAYIPKQHIDVIIQFYGDGQAIERNRLDQRDLSHDILDISLPKWEISVDGRRNPALLVETVVKLSDLDTRRVERDLIETHDALVSGNSETN